jgi:hypothetical protein
MLLALLGAVTPSGAAITQAGALCSATSPSRVGCSTFQKILPAADGESEEGEEELEEGEEEDAAPTEAKPEEAGSGVSSPSNRAVGPPPSTPGSSPKPVGGVAVVSRLTLTARATSSLRRRTPKASTVEFSFVLSAPARVKVTLVRQTRKANHEWAMLPDSLTISVAKGPVNRRLLAHNRLSPGRYRLTVRPLNGVARSIYLKAKR